jgi:hypothetical protein
MNDEFLYQYRQPPGPEFSRALYRRISAEPERPAVSITFVYSPFKQMAASLNLLGMAIAAVLAISPEARTRVWHQITDVI